MRQQLKRIRIDEDSKKIFKEKQVERQENSEPIGKMTAQFSVWIFI